MTDYKYLFHLFIFLFIVLPSPSTYAQEGAKSIEYFGAKLAVGNFNGDAYEDLVIGVVGDDEGGFHEVGGVHVLYGGPVGLQFSDDQFWNQTLLGAVPDKEELLGSAFAVADFDNDGYDDLAMGSPFEDTPESDGAGVVYVARGSGFGLMLPDLQVWYQGAGIQEIPEYGDMFGFSLEAGDFNGDSHIDLAIGAPGENFDGISNAGVVHILWGTQEGVEGNDDYLLHQNLPGLDGTVSEQGDYFGWALASGNFNKDNATDLAVGTPREKAWRVPAGGGNVVDTRGLVEVFYGDASNDLTNHWQHFYQGAPGIGGSLGRSAMGSVLTAGDLNGDGLDELIIGSPFEHTEEAFETGGIHILYASEDELNSKYQSQFFLQSDVEPSFDTIDNINFGGMHPGGNLVCGEIDVQTLATANIDGDDMEELIIGVPGHALFVDEQDYVNLVHVITGDSPAITPDNSEYWPRGEFTNEELYSDEVHFGSAVIGGDFDGDGCDDLAIGARQDGFNNEDYSFNPGVVYVMYNNAQGNACQGLDITSVQTLSQLTPGIFPGEANQERDDLIKKDPLSAEIPESITLSQNYPNPFNPSTEITFALPAAEHVHLAVYDLLGQQVATLANEVFEAGSHAVTWAADDLPSGTYLYRFTSGSFTKTRKMLLVK